MFTLTRFISHCPSLMHFKVVGLDSVIPDGTTAKLTPTQASEAALKAFSLPLDLLSSMVAAAPPKLIIWVDTLDAAKLSHHNANLAYLIQLPADNGGRIDGRLAKGRFAIIDAMDGEVLRSWVERSTQHSPRPRPKQEDSLLKGDSIIKKDRKLSAHSQPIMQQQQQTSSRRNLMGDSGAKRDLLQQGQNSKKDGLSKIWGIGGNNKVRTRTHRESIDGT